MKEMVYGSVITEKMVCVAVMNASDSDHILNRHLTCRCDAKLAKRRASRNEEGMHGVFEKRFYNTEEVMNEVLDFFDDFGYTNFLNKCKRSGDYNTLRLKGEVRIHVPCKNAGLVYFKNPEKAPAMANTIRLVFKVRESGLFNDPTGAKGLYLATAYPVL